MSQGIIFLIAVILTAVIVAPLSWKMAISHRKKTYEDKIGSAEVKSREIIEEALKTAETKKREALLEATNQSDALCLLCRTWRGIGSQFSVLYAF